ncbi:MAG: hypothetical protein ACJAY5_001797 [Actinomycetes bacterium]|jgi:hypothetical protein
MRMGPHSIRDFWSANCASRIESRLAVVSLVYDLRKIC